MTRRLLSLTAGCALLVAPGAWAQEVVWDSPPNNDLAAFVDQQFDDFPDFSTYLLACITLDRDTDIYDVTTYYTNANNSWPQGQIEAVLNIVPQIDGLPPNEYDPSGPQQGGAGMKFPADLAANGNRLSLTVHVEGAITLPPGKYWVGLTPKLNFGQFGQEFHKGTDKWLKNTAGRNPGGGFGVGTDWFEAGPVFGGVDWGMAITITGKNAEDACPWDLDGDGNVGTGDLILLLGGWGDPYGTEDLIRLLGAWGPCPLQCNLFPLPPTFFEPTGIVGEYQDDLLGKSTYLFSATAVMEVSAEGEITLSDVQMTGEYESGFDRGPATIIGTGDGSGQVDLETGEIVLGSQPILYQDDVVTAESSFELDEGLFECLLGGGEPIGQGTFVATASFDIGSVQVTITITVTCVF